MIRITPTIAVDDNEIQLDFIRSSGPGGQNVNKVSSAVQLRFDVANSPSLTDDIRQRLKSQTRGRITDQGVLIIEARQFRTQGANRQDAINRLADLIRKAAQKPRPRHKTKPTLASKERRLENKRRHSETKSWRRSRPEE